MNNLKNDAYYIEKILTDLKFISKHISNVSKDEFEQNEVLLDSMLFRLIQISENAKRLSEDYKSEHSNIPWNLLYGMRNRIVHDYGNVDLNVVYETLKTDIPELLGLFEN